MKASPDPDALVPQTEHTKVSKSLRPYPINFSLTMYNPDLVDELKAMKEVSWLS
jgi:hypothetical protein